MPILSVSCGEKQEEDNQVPVKVVKSTCINTRVGNGQYVCNNSMGTTKPKTKRVMFDCNSDGSTLYGGCEEERGEEQDTSENGSEDTKECRTDPNFLGILVSSSAGSEPLCEMRVDAHAAAAVVDSGSAETLTPKPKDSRI